MEVFRQSDSNVFKDYPTNYSHLLLLLRQEIPEEVLSAHQLVYQKKDGGFLTIASEKDFEAMTEDHCPDKNSAPLTLTLKAETGEVKEDDESDFLEDFEIIEEE